MKKTLFLSLALFLAIVTNVHSQACGSTFSDPPGPNANYDNDTNYTVTICPTNPGEAVTVTFTSFATEAEFDALYVFNGPDITSPQIMSTNDEGGVPGGLTGGFWGNTLPGPFTSTSPDGCLTFVFRSDTSVNLSGWTADVTCGAAIPCLQPTSISAPLVTANTARISWNAVGSTTSWQTYLAPAGSPAPTDTTTDGIMTSSSNTYTYTGLIPNTCYTVWVRSVCAGQNGAWTGGYNFCTIPLGPGCGAQFIDNGGTSANYTNNSNSITTICPTTPGDLVTVTFTSFNTEASWDGMYVYDGDSTAATQIVSMYAFGNGPLSTIPGAFWGNVIPGPFTASSASGCLTFNFRSDGSVTAPGWVAEVTCSVQPSCLRPTQVTATPSTDSVTLNWSADTSVNSWEVAVLPIGDSPNAFSVLQTVTTNPATITGLIPGTGYSFYIRANCSEGDPSYWSTRTDATTAIINDNCANAIEIPVSGRNCTQPIAGSLIGATASNDSLASTCIGTPDDDVWFKFTATDTSLNISLQNIVGTTTILNSAVYSGSCASLTPFACSTNTSNIGLLANLTIGATYYLRIFSNASTPQPVTFGVCITLAPNCGESESVCGITNYSNTTGVSSLGTVGCLNTTPNPTYLKLKIATSGPINLQLTQSTVGSAIPNLDIDYAAWGPFATPEEGCIAITGGQAPGIGVPVTTTTGCSYSANPTENLNIANAQAGEYYFLLVTNFSNRSGLISITQSNASEVGAGSYDCSGIRLNAFLDSNTNGTQDSGEPNFPLGQFHYQVNNNGTEHAIISSTGSYILYDPAVNNLYDLSYSINGDYSNQYTTPAGFTNVTVSSGSMTTYNFPVTAVQNYNDLGVTIVPQSAPRAGTSYTIRVVYTNNGNQTIPSGMLLFNNAAVTTISAISQSGTTPVANGFTYAFSNLLPFESREIIVTLSIPPLPGVSLGQLLTNTVSVTPPVGDTVANNNVNSSTEAVIGAYDPNDKMEGHGEKILHSSFTSADYLEYTIRFENNGTAGALDITVTDTLDNSLDETSLAMVASSHSHSLDRVGSELTWKFNNIQLPVSVPNTDIGKGFIKFKIKPKPGYAIGDIIPNNASIYFDTNPAIVTNTFNTEFVAALGNGLFTENSIILYPNPAKNTVNIALQNSTEIIGEITIFDIMGKKVHQVSNVASNQLTIDVGNLSKGMYLVEITTENHLKQIKKLIIQ
ncbi:DUF7619 domain-containing protein [Flavobacterium sp.]